MGKYLVNFFYLILIFFILGSPSELVGQERPFDNGEIETLTWKALQMDNYYGRSKTQQVTSNSFSSLLRYGLKKNFELQLTWAGQRESYLTKNDVSESTNLGVKAYLNGDKKYFPALALIASVNLTFDPKNTAFTPTLNLIYDKAVGDSWSVNGNYLVALDELKSDFSTGYSINIEAALTKWQNTYVGLIGNTSAFTSEKSSYDHYLEIGGLFWLYDGITLYPFYDFGLTDGTSDIFNVGLLFNLNE